MYQTSLKRLQYIEKLNNSKRFTVKKLNNSDSPTVTELNNSTSITLPAGVKTRWRFGPSRNIRLRKVEPSPEKEARARDLRCSCTRWAGPAGPAARRCTRPRSSPGGRRACTRSRPWAPRRWWCSPAAPPGTAWTGPRWRSSGLGWFCSKEKRKRRNTSGKIRSAHRSSVFLKWLLFRWLRGVFSLSYKTSKIIYHETEK